ncbi:MAG: Asp23/Gls24 family envelope stress response protein [Chloroflexota bacterium]
MDKQVNHGQIVVAPEVIMTVIREATLSVGQVDSMVSPSTSLFSRSQGRDGVTLQQSDAGLKIDIHVALEQNSNMMEVAKSVQASVSDAVDQIIGLEVESIDVHIEDITFKNNA